MAEALLLIMLVAVTLYAVLGGADFGAGMVEIFLGRKGREHVDAALLPVWEANHVWLVLVAVLAFVGFPQLFALVTTYLHIPVLLVLLGIVARGSAFTFRHYDPNPGSLDAWYTWAFRLGSALTPLFLGVIAAAIVEGRLSTDLSQGFYATFVAPWNTTFAWTTGVFACLLFAFEGAALLAAERHARPGKPLPFLLLAQRLHLAAIVWGGVVFLAAWQAKLNWFHAVIRSPWSVAALIIATLLVPVVARAFHGGFPWTLRLSTGAQVLCVLVGFFGADYPVLLRHRQGVLTVADVAPDSTLKALLVAVAIGLMLIVPSMVYLFRVYKVERVNE